MDALIPYHAGIAIGVVLLVFVGLQLQRRWSSDILFLSGLMLVTITGVITPNQAFQGFANEAVLTVAALLVVAAGLRSTGVLDWVGAKLLRGATTERGALLRLTPTLLVSSAFTLNTALVAMMMPVVMDWCRKRNVSPSRLLMPVSYLTILGGVCTLIGTSTTLVVAALLREETQIDRLTLFELSWVGIPCAVVGGLFMLLAGPKLLPVRSDMLDQLDEHRRDYLVEMMIQPACPLVGQTVEEAGLRHLPGLFLIEIDRARGVTTPVAPTDELQANDRLVFTGLVNTIVDLEKIPGLVPAADVTFEFHPHEQQSRQLTEVVLSRTSPLIGQTIREADFRRRYGAAVVAMHRSGERLSCKIGDVDLEPGDTLLLQTRHGFVPRYRNSRDFYLVSSVDGVEPRRHHKLSLAAGLGLILVAWLTATSFLSNEGTNAGLASTATASVFIALAMIATRCLRASEARNALDLQMLITIAAALGLGMSLRESGAAEAFAMFIVERVGDRPYLLLVMIYLITLLLTEMITNNAVAAMMIPLAIEVATASGYDSRPFIIGVTLAASLSFVTPIGYQTNLMVMGPGGYRASDYLRCGLPLAFVVTATALMVIPLVWRF